VTRVSSPPGGAYVSGTWYCHVLSCDLPTRTLITLGGAALVAAVVLHSARGCAAGRARPAILHSTSTHAFVAPDGRPVTLNGINVVPVWGTGSGRTWAPAQYRAIRRRGFDSVRFVLYWNELEPRRGQYARDRLATLDRAVAAAAAAGLRVVLDMIHLWGPGGMAAVPRWARTGDSVATVQASAIPYLRMLAARYAREPAVVAYDPVNEPRRWPIDQDGVLAMYDRVIAAIRGVAPDKIVLVEPSYGDSSLSARCADLARLTYRRDIVVSVHDYFAGGDDDGFGPDCAQAGREAFDGRTGYAAPEPGRLRAHLLAYLDALRPAGLPLDVGEFGMGTSASHQRRWVRDSVRVFDALGLSRAWWEFRSVGGHGRFSATDARGRWRAFVRLLGAPTTDPRGLAACA
jgi:Cellulase (glycosyl hydrolase family 5)